MRTRAVRALALLLLIALPVLGAPLPWPKPKPPAPAPAVYDALWVSGRYVMTFHANGRYECRCAGATTTAPSWVGAWSQDGVTLRVSERPAGTTGGYTCRWSVGPLAGGEVNGSPAAIVLVPLPRP